MVKHTFRGGVHPDGHKELSREVPLREFLPTGEMVFPLSQHIGKPAKPIVKKIASWWTTTASSPAPKASASARRPET